MVLGSTGHQAAQGLEEELRRPGAVQKPRQALEKNRQVLGSIAELEMALHTARRPTNPDSLLVHPPRKRWTGEARWVRTTVGRVLLQQHLPRGSWRSSVSAMT